MDRRKLFRLRMAEAVRRGKTAAALLVYFPISGLTPEWMEKLEAEHDVTDWTPDGEE